MFPWHTNRIFVIRGTLHAGVLFLSIAYLVRKVEVIIQMNISGDFPLQLQLRPSELMSGLDIPCPILGRQFRLQNDHVLCPANSRGLSQHFRCVFIGPVKLPHSAEIPGGEARGVRVSVGKVFGGGDSGAFLRPAVDQPANLAVQLHLRQIRRHQGVQRREHSAVVYRFSDVHSASPFQHGAPVFILLI